MPVAEDLLDMQDQRALPQDMSGQLDLLVVRVISGMRAAAVLQFV
jgi:hypothetical protein